ncbi:MAG: response regulator [Desulfobacterota bacterium]|nr:response regulator [Thermodesulfobacteriota bacterium]
MHRPDYENPERALPEDALINALLQYFTSRAAGEPLAKTIADGLEVFQSVGQTRSVTLYWLDPETFTFHFGASRPEMPAEKTEQQFQRLVDLGAVAAAIASVQQGPGGYFQAGRKGETPYLVFPLVISSGLLGLLLLEQDLPPGAAPLEVSSWTALGVQQFSRLLQNRLLARDLDQQKGILKQKITARTLELEKSERELRAILDSINAAVVIIDAANYRILECNKTALDIIGLEKAEVTGSFCHRFMCVLEKGRCPVIDCGQTIHNTEQELVSGNGSKIPVLKKVSPIFWNGRQCLVESFIDLTELKFLENQFHQTQKLEAIGRLAGGVAHDFNNLLMAIMGYSDLILMNLPQAETATSNQVREIKKAAQRAADLTQQLLDLSRKQVLEPKILDLNAIIIDFEKILWRLLGEDVELITVLDPTLGNIKGDRAHLEQIIVNLAINAREAMTPSGGKLIIETSTVTIGQTTPRRYPLMAPGPYALLAISDNGRGMDPETRSQVFEPFFTFKERPRRSGLGLSTVYSIVRQSGGYIWVYSEVNQGTTFKIYFPLAEENARGREGGYGPGKVLPGSETILLVEDEDLLRRPIREILEMNGYAVLEAGNGEEALRLAEEYAQAIDLLLTDVVMPGINGRELAERLTALRPNMRVLFMSGYTNNMVVHHGILEEGLAFLEKPFTPEALAVKIRQVLRGGPLRPGNGSNPAPTRPPH